MSTDYCLLKTVHACDLFDGRLLEKFNVREDVVPNETTKKSRCLTDGRNYLWVYINDNGTVCIITRYGGNAPGKILNAIAEAFDTDIVSEYEPQFWGFDTQEELVASREKRDRETEKEFHTQLLKYLRGEPNDIRPGTIGMIEAEIAKALVEGDPSLILPENADKLRNGIKTIYDRDHAVIVKLDDQQIALADMVATHEDDLPSA